MSEQISVSPENLRKRALITVGVTLALALAAWFGLNRAAKTGLARLEAYDRVRAACSARYANARNAGDTTTVDDSPISEVLDNGVASAPRRCGEFRKPGSASRQ